MKGQKYLCVTTTNLMFTEGKLYPLVNGHFKNEMGTYYPLDYVEEGGHLIPVNEAKWAIKRTPENADVVNKWANENIKQGHTRTQSYILNDYGACGEVPHDYTEIDLNTFKEITGVEEKKQDNSILEQNRIIGKNTAIQNFIPELKEQSTEAKPKKVYTIEDVKNGKCAIENDGTLDELIKVIKESFSNDKSLPDGDSRYYRQHYNERLKNVWIGEDEKTLPTQSVKLFLKQIEGDKEQPTEEWQPKWGEVIYYKQDESEPWMDAIYMGKGINRDIHAVEIYEDGLYHTLLCEFIANPKAFTKIPMSEALEIIAQAKGINVNQIKIV